MPINVTPIPRVIDLAVPAFTLGTSNVAGSAQTAVSSNSTLLAFDATLPDAITYGQSGSAGSAVVSSRRDHAHAMAAAYTDANAIAAVEGESTLVLTGSVLGRGVGKGFSGQNSTNLAVNFVGNNAQVSMADNQTFTITMLNLHGMLLLVGDDQANHCGAFFCSEASATVVSLADPGSAFDTTNTDNSKVAIFKSAGSQVLSIKNYRNTTINLGVQVLGPVASATSPS